MKSAYIDEYGAFGFQFDKPNCSSHFLICAIILDDNEKDIVEQGLEKIRAKYFQTGEIKSSKVRGNHRRRLIILEEIKKLPFHVSTSSAAVNYNPEIADICFRKAKAYIESNKSSKDDEIKQRVIVLEYMLFRFMNNARKHSI